MPGSRGFGGRFRNHQKMPPPSGNLSLSLSATLPARAFCVVFPGPRRAWPLGSVSVRRAPAGLCFGPPFLATSLPPLIIPFLIPDSRPLTGPEWSYSRSHDVGPLTDPSAVVAYRSFLTWSDKVA